MAVGHYLVVRDLIVQGASTTQPLGTWICNLMAVEQGDSHR